MTVAAPRTPIVIAHRGASGYRPEHTRSAYLLAIELGADAVEPDLVVTRDGVLVIRHENEISGTTDVSSRPEFAARRTTKTVDGVTLTGWFTEDFTWVELSTLRAIEPRPDLRPSNTDYDQREPIMRLEQLFELLNEHGRGAPHDPAIGPNRLVALVVEIKHAAYFASLGLHLEVLLAAALTSAGWIGDDRLTVESFELSFFARMRAAGVNSRSVFLMEAKGSPADDPGVTYASYRTDEGLTGLASMVDGISVDKKVLLKTDVAGRDTGTDLVSRAHAAGLLVYCWTLRAENRFLAPRHRGRGAESEFGDWPAEFALLLASGVDGVFADHPDLAVQARSRHHGV